MSDIPILTAVAATAAREALVSVPASAEALDDLDRRAREVGLVWDRYERAYRSAPIAPTPTRARNTGTLRAADEPPYYDSHPAWAVRRVEEGRGP